MRILIISSTVSQSISVGKIATGLEAYLTAQGDEARLLYLDCGPARERYQAVGNKLVRKIYYHLTVRSRYRYHWSPVSLRQIKKYIRDFQPDIIQLIQPWPGYIDTEGLFGVLGSTGLPCVYTMIDENAYLGDCDNAYECRQFIEGCGHCAGANAEMNDTDYKGLWSAPGSIRLARMKERAYSAVENICFAAPEWVISRAEKSQLLQGRSFYAVDEYVNNKTVFLPGRMDRQKAAGYGIDTDKIILLNVARFSNTRKGVRYFAELAALLEEDERYLFVNVGFDGDPGRLPRNYIGIPFVGDQGELAQFYSLADLFIITSLSDTMPNSCLEALSCGTPVCGFDITGIPYVAEPPLGVFVEPGNVLALKERVLELRAKKSGSLSEQCRNYALRRYAPEVYGAEMKKIYGKMIRRGVKKGE